MLGLWKALRDALTSTWTALALSGQDLSTTMQQVITVVQHYLSLHLKSHLFILAAVLLAGWLIYANYLAAKVIMKHL